jgi:hypothetical protein
MTLVRPLWGGSCFVWWPRRAGQSSSGSSRHPIPSLCLRKPLTPAIAHDVQELPARRSWAVLSGANNVSGGGSFLRSQKSVPTWSGYRQLLASPSRARMLPTSFALPSVHCSLGASKSIWSLGSSFGRNQSSLRPLALLTG